ncbi:class I SAM-dependent methyltransferase [Frateuria terrea]|uniref:Predicted methyltransferase n=1 Tax=Frateuria terrea TaxID=529704 RepID=A0A1H6QNN8_9GAMM|nr:class I SAM-dependent methyltransferase [Frateuria terrea]SEI45209.1 Predicted methyltransferase [Frateuria terrea]SFP10946.1 Predicted methyltransferase [Frateuria terrea]
MFRRTCTLLILLAGAAWLPGVAPAQATRSPDSALTLQQAVDGPWRPAANRARDRYRHPVQTLQFFGIRPDMTVVELAPGGGWYTEILAPYLGAKGHLIEAGASAKFAARLKAEPAIFGRVAGTVPFAPPGRVQLGAANSADMVLTFRNTHDWLNDSPAALAAAFRAAFAVLKPGGVFGVVEHRARPFADAVQSSRALHRLPEDYLIALALKTGFRLDGVAQINANPRDPEDVNVHRLPPDLAGPDGEHAKMRAIGESDRMTLRFVKP